MPAGMTATVNHAAGRGEVPLQTRRFAGPLALIFQPAEEDGGGGEVMVQQRRDGPLRLAQVYGIHNAPNVPFGKFVTTPGPLMAAVDTATVYVTGKGGHGATPHETHRPGGAIVGMVGALQTIISRNLYTLDDLVLSVTQIHAGTASNIIPEEGWFCATIRTFTPEVRELVRRRFHEIVQGHAAAYGCEARIDYELGYPPTVNHPEQTEFAAEVAREVSATIWSMRGRTARWGRRISPTCSRPAPAPICFWAPAGRGAASPGLRLQ